MAYLAGDDRADQQPDGRDGADPGRDVTPVRRQVPRRAEDEHPGKESREEAADAQQENPQIPDPGEVPITLHARNATVESYRAAAGRRGSINEARPSSRVPGSVYEYGSSSRGQNLTDEHEGTHGPNASAGLMPNIGLADHGRPGSLQDEVRAAVC